MSFENSYDLFNIFQPTDFFESEKNFNSEKIHKSLDSFENRTSILSNC